MYPRARALPCACGTQIPLARIGWRRRVLALAAVVALSPTLAAASGFATREQSASQLGTAFAGAAATADDISTIYFNPAGLTRQSGDRGLLSLSVVAPKAEFHPQRATTVTGATISGGNGGSDAAGDGVIPALYAFWDASPDLKAGLGINAPYALSTRYAPDWVGRYHTTTSEIETVSINPVVAYRVTDALSIGGGPQIDYTKTKLANAIDFGTLDVARFSGSHGGVPGRNDGSTVVQGDDWGLGYSLGGLYELDGDTRIGAAYRSRVRHQLSGMARFDRGGAVGNGISGASGAFVDTGAKASLDLPETLSFGITRDVSPDWRLSFGSEWTNWSRVEQIRIRFENTAQSDSVLNLRWKDTWFHSVGATYRLRDNTRLRFGAAYDQTPTTDATRSPRLPDSDRYWLSAGVEYRPAASIAIDFAYTHIFMDAARLALSTADSSNTFRGNLAGTYDTSIDILALQIRFDL